MKRFLFLLLVCSSQLLWAQRVDYNTIILPSSASDISFEEKLVRLAWQNNPENKILNHQVNISRLEVTRDKWSWLDKFGVSGNLNEFVLNQDPEFDDRANFFPRYNIFGNLSVGTFVTIPTNVKIRKQELLIAESNINRQKLTIRAEVLRRYQFYLMNKELLKIQTEATEDAFTAFSLVEQNFKNGESTLEEYSTALNVYNDQMGRKITSESNFAIAKINIEELIGVKLEEVQ